MNHYSDRTVTQLGVIETKTGSQGGQGICPSHKATTVITRNRHRRH